MSKLSKIILGLSLLTILQLNAAGCPLKRLTSIVRRSSQQFNAAIQTKFEKKPRQQKEELRQAIENKQVRKFMHTYRIAQDTIRRKYTYGGYLYASIIIPMVTFGNIGSEVMAILSSTGYTFINIFTQQLTSKSIEIGLEIESIKTLEAAADYLENAPDLHPEDYETQDIDKHVAQALREQAAKLRAEQEKK